MYAALLGNKNIRGLLHYHELKVKKGVAEVLFVANYLRERMDLSRDEKLYPFERRIALNDTTTKKVLHIAIKFNPGDQLSNAKMIAISKDYLQRMNLGEEPCLSYVHRDIPQTHLHL